MRTATQKLLTFFAPSKHTLISPFTDFMVAGGAAIIVFIIVFKFFPAGDGTFMIGWVAYYLAFIANYPHFAASYQLLYGDQQKRFFAFKDHPQFTLKLWWAGVLAPLLLVAYFVFAANADTVVPMGYLVNAMFFFVGWHYIKQTFGVVIVLSSAAKVYYSRIERYIILTSLYTLWFLSYVGSNVYAQEFIQYGIPYSSFAFPPAVLDALYWVVGISTAVMLGMLVRKYITDKKTIPLAALAGLTAIFVWFVPLASHPQYYFVIPFFHSVQYLLFVSAYKRNQVTQESSGSQQRLLETVINICLLIVPLALAAYIWINQYTNPVEDQLRAALTDGTVSTQSLLFVFMLGGLASYGLTRLGKRSSLWKFISFMYASCLLGFLMFIGIPVILDNLVIHEMIWKPFAYNTDLFGITLYFFFFTIFVNIHHYFIDNVIWRRDNPSVRKFLFR